MKPLDRIISSNLYEEDDELSKKDHEDEKDKSIDKVDLDDTSDNESDTDKEIVLSIKLNGKIKLLSVEEASNIFDLTSVLSLYNIDDISNIPKDYLKKDKIEIVFTSPLSDFKYQTYIVKMLKGLAQLEVHRDDLDQTYTSREPVNMQKAVEQNISPTEVTPYVYMDASKYFENLNNNFVTIVKKQFIDRLVASNV